MKLCILYLYCHIIILLEFSNLILAICNTYTGLLTIYVHCYCNSGVGVFANQHFKAGDFLLEYVGERMSKKEGEYRERRQKVNLDCFQCWGGGVGRGRVIAVSCIPH